MKTRIKQFLRKLLLKEPEKKAPPRRTAPSNTTTSMRALTDLGDSIAASVHVIEATTHLYLCVSMEPKPEALAAQIAKDRKMAKGMFEVDETWSAAEVNKRWAKDAYLVDVEGERIERAMKGARGMTEAGAKEVFFEFNSLDVYPEKLYLTNGRTRVRVK